ncbi:MAG: PHP domain-containing protein [Christensenellales bacterium]|jgi:hypothetical protein
MIKIETHCHSKPASRCSKIKVAALVDGLKAKGYAAAVLTNHYYGDDLRSPQKIFDEMLFDYQQMADLGNEAGLRVFFGVELRFVGSNNDYLLYGMTPDELKDMGPVYDLGLEGFHKEKPPHVLIYQAHPFRDRMTRAEPSLLDGVEVHNGHPGHDSRNELALAWAKETGRLMISGSDTHFEAGMGTGGVRLAMMPRSERELAAMLRQINEDDLLIKSE